MRNTLSQAIKIVFSPETILPFLVGSVFLSVFGNAIYDICKNIFGTTTPGLLKIAAISLFILVVAVLIVWWVITQRFARLPIEVPFEVQQKALDRRYKGLILLVSNVETCQTAIRFHQSMLKRCWLICSPKTLDQAKELRRQFPQCVDEPIVVNDVYDPVVFYQRINEIYQTRLPNGWQESDIIADYTGMTAHASVGMVLACVGTNRPLEYTPAKTDRQDKIAGSLSPIKVTLDFYGEAASLPRGSQPRLFTSIKKVLGF